MSVDESVIKCDNELVWEKSLLVIKRKQKTKLFRLNNKRKKLSTITTKLFKVLETNDYIFSKELDP